MKNGISEEDELHEFIHSAVNVGVPDEIILSAGIKLIDMAKALRRKVVYEFEFDDEEFEKDMKNLSKEQVQEIQHKIRDLIKDLEKEQEERNKQGYSPVRWITDEVIVIHADVIIGRKVVTYRKIEELGERRINDDDFSILERYYSVELSDSKERHMLREVIADTGKDEKPKYLYVDCVADYLKK